MTTTLYLFDHISDKFTFGKYCGYTLSDVLDKNEEYVDWCMMNVEGFVLTDEVMDEFKKIYQLSSEISSIASAWLGLN